MKSFQACSSVILYSRTKRRSRTTGTASAPNQRPISAVPEPLA